MATWRPERTAVSGTLALLTIDLLVFERSSPQFTSTEALHGVAGTDVTAVPK
jgi:hypothetical protein